jgi:hypothetical protein
MNKENNIQRAIRQRDEILTIVDNCFLTNVEGEDNSYKVKHNLLQLELLLEPLLLQYFKKIK